MYIQTPIESVGWEAMDSMTFSVTSPPTSLDGQTFKIDISYENTGPEHNTVLLANTGKNKSLQPFQQFYKAVRWCFERNAKVGTKTCCCKAGVIFTMLTISVLLFRSTAEADEECR